MGGDKKRGGGLGVADTVSTWPGVVPKPGPRRPAEVSFQTLQGEFKIL